MSRSRGQAPYLGAGGNTGSLSLVELVASRHSVSLNSHHCVLGQLFPFAVHLQAPLANKLATISTKVCSSSR